MAEQIVSALQLTIIAGASFSDAITWKDSTGALVPLPVGTTAEIQVRSSLDASTVLLRFATSPGPNDGLIVLSNPGVATLSLTAAKTTNLTPVAGAVFDIKYVFTDGRVIIKLNEGQGRVDILKAVTRP